MIKVNADNLFEVFTYQTPTSEQVSRMSIIRDRARVLAQAILEQAPECPDQTAAIRKVREAVMTANAAIVLEDVH